jgi:hypothetical protein
VRTITGRATFKIVLSRLTISRLTQSTARTNRRPRGTVASAIDPGGPSRVADGVEPGTTTPL